MRRFDEMTQIELSELWVNTKAEEQAATALRYAIEEELLKKMDELPDPEASKTYRIGSFKVTVKRSQTYTLDKQADLDSLCAPLPAELRPIKRSLDPTGLKWLRENRPELYAKIAKGISVKPAKTNVSITLTEEP
jgi:hypothetical protein